ncbi:MAG: histone deacetylase family protein [Desulfurococcaceae archaeon]
MASPGRVILFVDAARKHRPREHHPENPTRVSKVKWALEREGIGYLEVGGEDLAGHREEALRLAERIHAAEYVERLEALSRGGYARLDEDTFIAPDSFELALGSLWLSYAAAGDLGSGEWAFLIIRPPGHHAGRRGRALGAPTQGFCLLNNAVAALLGFLDRGMARVALLDFDVHHGNGTMEILYEEPILVVDVHEDPAYLYPHTGYPHEVGRGRGAWHKVNLPLAVGSGDESFVYAIERATQLVKAYGAEALVVSAGFDAYANDGLADLEVDAEGYWAVGTKLRDLGLPTAIVLEGGYSLGLTEGLPSFVSGLAGLGERRAKLPRDPRFGRNKEVVDSVISATAKGLGLTGIDLGA